MHSSSSKRTAVAIAFLVLAIGAVPRFFLLERDFSPNGVDEGVQMMEGRMWAKGNRLYSSVNSMQPPLMLWAYGIIGAGPVFFRALSGLCSLAIVAMVMWGGKRVGGPLAMISAGALLLMDWTFLQESRLASLDMFCLFACTASVPFLIRFRNTGGKVTLLTAGMLMGLASMIKLFGAVFAFGALIVLLLDMTADSGLVKSPKMGRCLPQKADFKMGARHIAVFILGSILPVLVIAWLSGPSDLLQGVILDQMHRPVQTILKKLAVLSKFLLPDLAMVLLAVPGIIHLYRKKEGMVLIIGTVMLVFFLLQASTFQHHLIFISPVLALAAGTAVPVIIGKLHLDSRGSIRTKAAAAGLMLTLAAGIGSAMVVQVNLRGRPATADISELVREYTTDGDYIITGDPLIAVLSDRNIPPEVVNVARVQHPPLSLEDLTDSAVGYSVKCIVLTYHLSEIEGFRGFLDANYALRAHLTDRSNPSIEEHVDYWVYVLPKESPLSTLPEWGSKI